MKRRSTASLLSLPAPLKPASYTLPRSRTKVTSPPPSAQSQKRTASTGTLPVRLSSYLLLDFETSESHSEGSSLMVDEGAIRAALTCDQEMKQQRTQTAIDASPVPTKRGKSSSVPSSSLRSTLSLPGPSPTLKAFLSARPIKPQKPDEGLMLSPRATSAVSRFSIVNCGPDPTPELIHSRQRNWATHAGKAQIKLANCRTKTEGRSARLLPRSADRCRVPAWLLASKGERAIITSKTGKLLKCFQYST